MTAQSIDRPRKYRKRPLKPHRGSKAESILTLTTTTPATPIEIAESLDTSISNVSHTLKRYGITPNIAESYKKHRADIIAGIGEKILEKVKLDDLKIDDAKSLKEALTGWGILYDKERIELGKVGQLIGVGVALSPALQESIDKIIQRKTVDNPVDTAPLQDSSTSKSLNTLEE